MPNTVKWNTFEDTDVDSFNVYRAITGVVVVFPNSLQVGDELVFAATSPTTQRIVISATDIDSLIAELNSLGKGIKASKNIAETKLFIRCTARTNPRLKLYPSTFLSNASVQARIIAPRAEFEPIANVSVVPSQDAYEFDDVDGDPLDWYHVTSIKASVESIPSADQQSFIVPADLCVVEGRIIDLQNNPVVGAEVYASVMVPTEVSNNSAIVTPKKSALTDELGRWSLPLIQGRQTLFEIPAVGYNQVVVIPSQAAVLFRDLKPVNDYYFSPAGDPE